MNRETVSERTAVLAETTRRTCRRCGANVPFSAAEDETYFIDIRQVQNSGGIYEDEIYCPTCW